MDKPQLPNRYTYLASKWKNRSITPEEAKEFAEWYNEGQEKEVFIPKNFAEDLNDLENSIYQDIKHKIYPVKQVSLWSNNIFLTRIGIVAAAAIVIMVMGISYFYYGNQIVDSKPQIAKQNDIAPGKDGATLTLSNGNKILISDALSGDIANEAGVQISKTADGQIMYTISSSGEDAEGRGGINTLSTTRGEQVQVRLPDGTLVFLNAESSLKYPTTFENTPQRQVFLTGEAYFEVAKDKLHPFIVRSAKQSIEVLGTHFNVNTYDNERSNTTTLIEGAVKISVNDQNKVLKPGQQATNNGADIAIQNVDVSEAVSWKDGYFDFTDADIQTVMRQFARWYNVEVVFDGPITKETFTGRVPRKWNLSQVLKIVKSSNSVKITVEGRRIMVRE